MEKSFRILKQGKKPLKVMQRKLEKKYPLAKRNGKKKTIQKPC